MSLFNKKDMVYNDYKWTAYSNDNPKVTGKPDSTELNRHEGYEMLYFINKLAEEWNFKQVSSCQKMEKMIRGYLPSSIRSQERVRTWISENWNKFS